jgi:hypothetical protein
MDVEMSERRQKYFASGSIFSGGESNLAVN